MKLNLDNLKIYFRPKKGTKWLVHHYDRYTSLKNIINKMIEREYDFKIEYINPKEN